MKSSEPTRLALVSVMNALQVLERDGWATRTPPPRDREIEIVTAGSTGTFRGRWVDGAFFVEDGGDLWPATPLAWREVQR